MKFHTKTLGIFERIYFFQREIQRRIEFDGKYFNIGLPPGHESIFIGHVINFQAQKEYKQRQGNIWHDRKHLITLNQLEKFMVRLILFKSINGQDLVLFNFKYKTTFLQNKNAFAENLFI